MNYEYIIPSPCKINLSLEVLNKRDDGYHNLESIFQLISLMDYIYAIPNSHNDINISGDFDCELKDNLIYKAVSLFFSHTGVREGWNFVVDKQIPQGGGLGGGSSNAGAVLRFLDYKYTGMVSKKELFDMALSLGSDVPFFLKYPTALVRGRGEVLVPLKTHTNYSIITINPKIHISTKDAFLIHHKYNLSCGNTDFKADLVQNYLKGINFFNYFKNSFEIALQSDYNFINDIKLLLKDFNFNQVMLTGSGSTMFAISNKNEVLVNAFNILKSAGYEINLVKPLSCFPEISRKPLG